MSRSRYYPGRCRPRGYGKGDPWDTLYTKRERLRRLDMELVDGYREFHDTWDQDRNVLDYRTGWVHEHEARYRHHRTRNARRRDKQNDLMSKRFWILDTGRTLPHVSYKGIQITNLAGT